MEKPIDIKRLFYFSKVFEYGSINAVADRLNRVQAGIGRQIQLLEGELGMRLFERGTRGRGMVMGGQGRGMVPTEAAQLLYDFYRQFCDQQDKLEIMLQEIQAMKRGNIRIAVFTTYADALMDDVINNFHFQHPTLDIAIQEFESSARIERAVLQDDMHMGIVYGWFNDHPDIAYYKRAPLPARLVIHPKHPLAQQKMGGVSALLGHPVIVPPAVHSIGKLVESVEQSEKISLSRVFSSPSIIARKQAVIAGYGGAFMSAFAARQEIKAGQLISFAVDHPRFHAIEVGLIARRSRPLSPAANQLLRLIAAKFSAFSYRESDSLPQ